MIQEADKIESDRSPKAMQKLTVDDVLSATGHFGWSQRLYYMCISLLHFFIASHMLLTVFTGLEPSFVCYLSDSNGRDHNNSLAGACVDNSPAKCQSIIYTTHYQSFAAEWDLICSEKYKVAMVQSVWMGGVMSGALLLGGVADTVGRLRTLMVALLGTIAFEGFSAFSPTYLIMVALRFLGGMCCAVVILVSFVLSQELVGSEWRSFCGICLGMFFAVGIGIFSALAAVVSTWRILTVICSVSGVVFLLLPCYVPESPRWLVSQGHLKEAKQVLEGMATLNGTLNNLPSQWELSATGTKKSNKKAPGIRLLFSHPYVTLLVIILIYSWFVNSATYYGLTMAASDLGGDVYVSTALNGLIEVPAGLIALAIIDRLGRRLTLSGFMILGGVTCLSIQFVPQHLVMVSTGLALCGKLSISASFSSCYIHSVEIFPTVIRNSGMGLVSVAARVGGMLAPFILMLGDVYPSLQFSALGLLTLLAGLINLKLPETRGKSMPETVADILALRDSTHDAERRSKQNYKYNKLEDVEGGSGVAVVGLEDAGDVGEGTDFGTRTLPPHKNKGHSIEDQVPLLDDEDL